MPAGESEAVKKVAVIDTGTNSTRMLVAAVAGTEVTELERRIEITRLGAGVDRKGRLDEAACQRVEACLEEFARVISRYQPERVVIIATSSVRDAADGASFIAALASQYGYDYSVLAGEQEARLSFTGATLGISTPGRVMFFDIGGGSTEVAAGTPGEPDYVRSLNLGCVRLTERFFKDDPPSPRELEAASDFVDGVLTAGLSGARLGQPEKVVAVAGTMTSLAAIDLGLREYDRSRVDGYEMSRQAVEASYHRLASLGVAERARLATLDAGRADVIVAGALIAVRILAFAGLESVQVRESDILDGAAVRIAAGELATGG